MSDQRSQKTSKYPNWLPNEYQEFYDRYGTTPPDRTECRRLIIECVNNKNKIEEWNQLRSYFRKFATSKTTSQFGNVAHAVDWSPDLSDKSDPFILHGDVRDGDGYSSLANIDLSRAMLELSSIQIFNFYQADFRNAVLESAHLFSCLFIESKIVGAYLSKSVFTHCHFEDTKWHYVKAPDALFSGITCHRSVLVGANFSGSIFRDSDFETSISKYYEKRTVGYSLKKRLWRKTGRRLLGTIVQGPFPEGELIVASQGRLDNSDMRSTSGFISHGQSARGTTFSSKPRDPYSIVRSEYTGSMMLFHFAALAIFFTPLVLRTAIWVSAGRLQHAANTDSIAFSESRRVISLVMGAESGAWLWGWFPAIPAFVMLFYNILRIWMTWWLGKVRDAEERSQHLPMIEDYWWCYWLHKNVMRVVFRIATALFVWHFVGWMSTSVVVPT
tara:strand:+ start:134 stop:1462 length:1329 start_codon:yes stop_codon:yes gene_type:complete